MNLGRIKVEYDASGPIIGDGDRKSWDPGAPKMMENVSIFRANCVFLTSHICANPRTCRGTRMDVVTLPDQNGESGEVLLQILNSDAGNKARDTIQGSYM